jgi:hypothetical protein
VAFAVPCSLSEFALCYFCSQPAVHGSRIAELVAFVANAALRRNTQASYANQQRNWFLICAQLGLAIDRPVSERQLCAACIVFCLSDHKFTTLSVFASAVNAWHLDSFAKPLPRNYLFKRVQAGLANIFASTSLSETKIGLDIDQLASIYKHIEFGSFDECRDWCMFIFAFFGLLRVSEYTGGSLQQSDVVATRAGVSIWLPFHKTSPTPVRIEISRRSDCLCPVRAYRRYCAFLGAVRSEASLPFFVSSLSSRKSMSDRAIITSFRSKLSAIGVRNLSDYAGHSFRRGGFSAMCAAGVPFALAQSHGRWKSLSYQRYIDTVHSAKLRLLATALLGERTTRRN